VDKSWFLYVAFRGGLARLAGFALAAGLVWSTAARAEEAYRFHVLNSRSGALAAQYWNPILNWVAQKSGVPLELRVSRNARESNAMSAYGAYQFAYSDDLFTPEHEKLGFRVIARTAGPALRGQIIVRSDSPIASLHELNGKQMAFGSPDAFAAYWLPMDALLRSGVNVKVVFTPDQETGLAQLKAGTVAAVAVNESSALEYAAAEGFAYRLLWSSEPYNSHAIVASPKVPAAQVSAVRAAFVGMKRDPDGRRILEAGGHLLKSRDAAGFVEATDREYENHRAFYRKTLVQSAH
jgi:phosphonate transport system substrate-binding protein